MAPPAGFVSGSNNKCSIRIVRCPDKMQGRLHGGSETDICSAMKIPLKRLQPSPCPSSASASPLDCVTCPAYRAPHPWPLAMTQLQYGSGEGGGVLYPS